MNIIKRMASIAAVLAVILVTGCSGDDPVSSPVGYEIPADVVPDIEKSTVVVISTAQQFQEAFGNAVSKLEEVDFKKANLAVVTGVSDYGISEISRLMTAGDNGKWNLSITITQNLTAVVQPWTVAYLVAPGTRPDDIRLDLRIVAVSEK